MSKISQRSSVAEWPSACSTYASHMVVWPLYVHVALAVYI